MSADTIIHRIVRPAVRLVAPSRITPNHITTLRLITGIAAAVAFAAGDDGWLAIGAAIFLLSMLLDRADGELARQTGQSSVAGHRYDLVSDCFSNIIAFIGLGIGQMGALGLLGPALGVAAGLAVGVLFWQLHILRVGQVRGYRLAPGILVDPDDLLVFVPILVWAGATVPMLFAAAIITPAAALWLAIAGSRQGDAERGA
ncbi:CDP-alcohol phosphatidyltransferase family protein [Roseomonas marmotae]|uniref:CDP-alcohol phosphatidyltransferase family protein n=1 Tax=Roseomonas marmotae TaxID=2768161 RepID=A0ABS3KKH4_9PROT|nr:CDP-alcohol phosphatidyltransferase family protein [Roseomonas marmotae]MBO1077103.1 CDP-alcohol phosphatidyltransferase family protein [Roseomonas marmotae]QTI81371.1 CDP-alcohol phosphatidyltransferase family protein [Roseomonas marmotae]